MTFADSRNAHSPLNPGEVIYISATTLPGSTNSAGDGWSEFLALELVLRA